MESPVTRSRARPLRQAAAAVFAVTTIVPLLIFVWTLHRLDALSQTQAQIGLGLALALALLGFQIFRVLMGRMSDLVQSLGKAVEQAARSAQRSAAATPPPVATPAPAAAAQGEARVGIFSRPPGPTLPHSKPDVPPAAGASGTAALLTPPDGTGAPAPLSQSAAVRVPRTEPALTVPGIGDVQEVQDLSRAMALLWMSEATVLKGHRVSISILGAPRPVTGALVEITDDGLVVAPDGTGPPIVLGYARIASIDPERLPDAH